MLLHYHINLRTNYTFIEKGTFKSNKKDRYSLIPAC